MTNTEIAKTLMDVANVYGTTPDETVLKKPLLTVFATSKEEVKSLVHAVGGKFTKRLGYGGDSVYYESARIPGFSVHVDRAAVCVKIPARYECEPLFSPEEEAELVEA